MVERRITRDGLDDLTEDVIVNAAGLGALELFDDPAPTSVIRGCLVHVAPPTTLSRPVSYNYTPGPAVYQNAQGEAVDVYFYPRADAWILGGSRRLGTWADGAWSGAPIVGPTVDIGGQAVPEPVLTVNRALIQQRTGADIAAQPMRATFGYRFARDLDGDGVRLGVSEERGRPVAHNYGHGGAGVTLSWSCAITLARRLHEHGLLDDASPIPHTPAADLQRLIHREVLG